MGAAGLREWLPHPRARFPLHPTGSRYACFFYVIYYKFNFFFVNKWTKNEKHHIVHVTTLDDIIVSDCIILWLHIVIILHLDKGTKYIVCMLRSFKMPSSIVSWNQSDLLANFAIIPKLGFICEKNWIKKKPCILFLENPPKKLLTKLIFHCY